MQSIPLLDVRLRNSGTAESVKTKRVQRTDPVRIDGEVAVCQFGRGRPRKARNEHRARTVLLDGALHLTACIGGLSGSGRSDDSVFGRGAVVFFADTIEGARGALTHHG